MNENKNVIVALVLMLAVWVGFTFLFPPKPSPEATQDANMAKEVSSAEPVQVPEQVQTPALSAGTAEAETPATGNLPAATVASIRNITVETARYTAVFSSSGARLISFTLNDYRKTAADDAPPVQLINTDSLRYATLQTTGTEGFTLAIDAPYEVDSSNDLIKLQPGEGHTLQFRSVTSSGLEVVKTYAFKDGHYSIDLQTTVRNLAAGPLTGALELALIKYWDDDEERDAYSFAGPATLVGDDLEKVKVKKLKKESPTYGSDAAWTSIQSKYFIDVVVPQENAAEQTRVSRDSDRLFNTLKTAFFTLQPGSAKQFDYFLFFGPKDLELLKAEGHQLDKTIDFGFFEVLAKPLLYFLTFFYGYLKNYGLAIISLTIIIKILFWPLTHKSYASMKSMQKLQPEMQKLRERFKSDKERLNKELMGLYKTHRVNPMGGCLPMLVQIPVFFALYKVLLDSIALRHAPFAFWLTDLSAKDPYYITPVLMGLSMFVQQKLTPTAGDPMQAKIMTFLPVIFTFMFLNFPSGLVIYWLVNNLLTIVQQYYIHRKN